MSLRELTKDAHTDAETQPFVKILFSGSIDPKLYATYLKNQHPAYEMLEVCAMQHGLLNGLPDIRRAPSILSDFIELWSDNKEAPHICPATLKYVDYVMSIKDQPEKLLAHMYVRHMGDLAGGQMIAKRVPGSGKYYQFEDPEALKAAIREKLDYSLADEAIVCFSHASQLFVELMELVDE